MMNLLADAPDFYTKNRQTARILILSLFVCNFSLILVLFTLY